MCTWAGEHNEATFLNLSKAIWCWESPVSTLTGKTWMIWPLVPMSNFIAWGDPLEQLWSKLVGSKTILQNLSCQIYCSASIPQYYMLLTRAFLNSQSDWLGDFKTMEPKQYRQFTRLFSRSEKSSLGRRLVLQARPTFAREGRVWWTEDVSHWNAIS